MDRRSFVTGSALGAFGLASAGMFAGAGYAGHLTVLFLSFALWWALGYWFDNLAWAALVVAVLVLEVPGHVGQQRQLEPVGPDHGGDVDVISG